MLFPIRCAVTVFAMLLTLSQAVAKDLFEVYELQFKGDLVAHHFEDINQDGLQDLLLFLSQNDPIKRPGSWIAVYLQNEKGFLNAPTQQFQLSDQIIVFDIGDVQGNSQKEFVFFGDDGIYFYPWQENSFDLSPRLLFNAESIFMLADPSTPNFWNFVSELNGKALEEVLVPGISKSEIYFRDPEKDTWTKTEVGLAAESRFGGEYHERFSVGNRVESRYATPYIALEDFNNDGRKDLIGVYKDRLAIFCLNENGHFEDTCSENIPIGFGEIWRGQKIHRTHIGEKSERLFLKRVKDLNADGLLDVIGMRVSTKESIMSPEYEIRIHSGKKRPGGGLFFSSTPDQTIKPEGTQLVFDIMDLNHDGRDDLVTPIVRVGLRNILRMLMTRSVQIEGEVYLQNEEGLYPEKPTSVVKMVVNFSFRGGTTSPVYEIADFNGDGLVDVMTSIEEKRLLMFWGNSKSVFDANASTKFNIILPQNGELVEAARINADNKWDLIIKYNEDNPKYRELTDKLRILLAN